MKCPYCKAPHSYLYYNDGVKRSQIRCKVCNELFQAHSKTNRKPSAKYFCPHCSKGLSLWKKRSIFNIYKCYNKQCCFYIANKKKLNFNERLLFTIMPFEFKLHYQFKEFIISEKLLRTTQPKNPGQQSILNIRNSLNTFCLVLTFYISTALSARKTAWIIKNVFGINISNQTVLNYAKIAAYHCHKFNDHYKGVPDFYNSGDETYIKINGKWKYAFFFISVPSLKIYSYHIADKRDAQNAIASMNDVVSRTDDNNYLTFIADGNPAYQAAINFFNMNSKNKKRFDLKQVIGLFNQDEVSEEFRYLKQIIERFNRTYKHHIRAASGFKSKVGAISLTALIVTFYNFLRPHSSLNFKPPIVLDFLDSSDTIQARWAKILNTAIDLELAS